MVDPPTPDDPEVRMVEAILEGRTLYDVNDLVLGNYPVTVEIDTPRGYDDPA